MNLDIREETIIICDSNCKKRFLNKMNNSLELVPVHFMTVKEFIKKYVFDYDYKAILYLMKKYNFKYEIAKVYLDNLYYIENVEYRSDKLNKLKKIKEELENENLLIYDELFRKYANKISVIVYKNDLSDYESSILNSLPKVKIIEKTYRDYRPIVYKFKDAKKEVIFVAEEICRLIKEGNSVDNIYLSMVEGYETLITNIFKMYHIPVNLEEKKPIYSTAIAKKFLDNYSGSFNEAIESIVDYSDNDTYNKIIDICNKLEDGIPKEFIIYEMKHTYIESEVYDKAVSIIDFRDNDIENEYVFILGFNLGRIPFIYKDEDFITDSIKDEVRVEYTVTKNEREKLTTYNSINSIKNLVITYKEFDKGECYPSSLIGEYEVIECEMDHFHTYSKELDKLRLATYLDTFIKYNDKNEYLDLYSSNYDIPYLSYDNTYKKIDSTILKKHLNNELHLSYSSMDKYIKCPFRYYLSSILHLDKYEENFYTILGSLFHHILRIGINNEIDIQSEIEKYIKDVKLDNKGIFYIKKLTKELPFIIETINEQLSNTKLKDSLEEQEVIININSNIKVTFKGYIDKILYREEEGKTILALVDYKTGDADIDLKYIPYGLNLQLPIYLYLASNLSFKNISFAGFYLQKILLQVNKKSDTKTLLEQKKDYLRLEGYSNMDDSIISKFDINYKDSSFIKGLKVKNDGTFYESSKLVSDQDIKNIISMTRDKIDEVIEGISSSKFDINPKNVDGSLVGCQFCEFSDICYRTRKDEIYIKINNDSLGGDDDE